MPRLIITLLTGLVLAGCGSTTPTPTTSQASESLYAYSLVAPLTVSPSGLVARVVLPGGSTCPPLTVDANAVAMQPRQAGATTKGAFSDVEVCSAPIPTGATKASINDSEIPPAMPAELKTVAATADTGCMIFDKVTQNCNSATDWPFGEIAAQIAKADPDLIIHVGDYFYRENPCPASQSTKCGGSPAPPKGMPFLDSAAGWEADFFSPAKAMFSTAPLLAVRGNHETCNVAGNGYFLFLDPRPGTAQLCAPKQQGSKLVAPNAVTQPWKVDMRTVTGQTTRLAVVDSAYGWTYGQSPWWRKLRPSYQRAAKWAADKGVQTWLITHQPSMGLVSSEEDPGNVADWVPWVSGDQVAASHDLLGGYRAIVSGHLHLSEVVKVPKQPPQFIVGAGGTYLDRPKGYSTPKYGPLADSKGRPVLPGVKPYEPASYRWTRIEHSFGLATPNPGKGAWDLRFISPDGSTLAQCQISAAGDPAC